jgi:hypothetical protein
VGTDAPLAEGKEAAAESSRAGALLDQEAAVALALKI